MLDVDPQTLWRWKWDMDRSQRVSLSEVVAREGEDSVGGGEPADWGSEGVEEEVARKQEVAFTGGYPFAQGSTVTVEIAGQDYQLFTEGEWAWPAGEGEDAEIVAAMKNGVEAVLTGASSRGTQTEDTFSLMGFTEAMTEAAARCATSG